MKDKNWNLLVLGGTFFILAAIAAVTAVIDPFLHYHKPLESLEYPLNDGRYQSDGIARHYDYEAVIAGTSMAQNFKVSEFEELWSVETIKVATSGATHHEMNEQIRRVLDYNPDVKYVVSSFDGNGLNYEADFDLYEGIPEYLYDQNPFNDVKYLLNKEVIPKTIAVLNYTRAGNKTVSMDDYLAWGSYMTYGKEAILQSVIRLGGVTQETVLSEEDKTRIRENVTENFLKTALEHPDTEFYLFFPPYSAYFWDVLAEQKQLNAQLEAELIAVELMLQAENVHLFSFADKTDITFEADNYSDSIHYGPWISTQLLQYMYEGEGLLTEENYREHYEKIREIYSNCELEY